MSSYKRPKDTVPDPDCFLHCQRWSEVLNAERDEACTGCDHANKMKLYYEELEG